GRSDYPVPADRAYLEAFTTLSWIGGQTSRVMLGTGVCVLPYRHEILLAKIVGSLEVLCPGRLVLGVGVGWLREGFAALGVTSSGPTTTTASPTCSSASAGAPTAAAPNSTRCSPMVSDRTVRRVRACGRSPTGTSRCARPPPWSRWCRPGGRGRRLRRGGGWS